MRERKKYPINTEQRVIVGGDPGDLVDFPKDCQESDSKVNSPTDLGFHHKLSAFVTVKFPSPLRLNTECKGSRGPPISGK